MGHLRLTAQASGLQLGARGALGSWGRGAAGQPGHDPVGLTWLEAAVRSTYLQGPCGVGVRMAAWQPRRALSQAKCWTSGSPRAVVAKRIGRLVNIIDSWAWQVWGVVQEPASHPQGTRGHSLFTVVASAPREGMVSVGGMNERRSPR